MSRSRAGFTLLTVLLVVVLIGAIVAGVLSALRSQSISAIRGREESAARAIAETCADRMFAYSTSYIKEIAGGEAQPPADFDHLLDPNGIANDDDDFMPPGSTGSVAFVPPGSTNRAHRYRVMRLDGGACLVRFDDNSDDWHPGLGDRSTSNNTLVEGPAVGDEVLNRDRDRSIWVSVIGVFPAFNTTTDAEVWSRAHARVSVRRFLETAGGPAVWAGDDVTMTLGGTAICGLGGIVSESITRGSTNQCACGHQKHDTTTNAIDNECNYTDDAGDACDDRTRACEPNLREEAPQPSPQGTELPTPTTFNELPRPLTNQTCAVWLRDKDAPEPFPKSASETRYTHLDTPTGRKAEAEAFVWLPSTLRGGLIGTLTTALGASAACSTLLGSTLSACGAPAGGETCGVTPPTPLPPPCRYTANADGVLTLQECRGNESRCWMPVARLDGTKSVTTSSSFTDTLVKNLLGPLVPVLALSGTSGVLNEALVGDMIGVGEHTVIVGSPGTISHEYLSFQDKGPDLAGIVNALIDLVEGIPLVGPVLALPLKPLLALVVGLAGVTGVDTLVSTGLLGPLSHTLFSGELHWSSLCGGGCENCKDAQLVNVNGSSLTFGPGFVDQRNMPKGMTLVVENGRDIVNIPVAVGSVVAPTTGLSAMRMSLRVQGDVNWTGKSFACCPTCTCPGQGTAPKVAPKRRATNGVVGVPGIDCDSQAAALYLPDDGIPGLRSILHADGSCRVNGASTLIGRITCSNATIGSGGSDKPERDLGGCLIGGVDGRPTCGIDTPCAAPPTPPVTTPASFNTCGAVPGCDDSGVCVEGSVTIVGNVRSATDVCLRANTTVYGQVIAGDDAALERGIVINHDNAGSIGAVTQAQAWVESYP